MRHISALFVFAWMTLVSLGYAMDTIVVSTRGPKDSMTLNSTLASIGTQSSSILLNDGLWWITNNVVIPTNVSMVVERGTVLSVATNISVTIYGDIIAGAYRIFTGAGVVSGHCSSIIDPAWGAGTGLLGQALYTTTNMVNASIAASSNAMVTYIAGVSTTLSNAIISAVNVLLASNSIFSITNQLPQVGFITPYSSSNVPSGWLECNGTSVSRTTYSNLYSVVSTNFGCTNATTFCLPDLRGRFIRGWDHGSLHDPDGTNRLVSATNGVTGDYVGSYQGSAFAAHTHGIGVRGTDGTDIVGGGSSTALVTIQSGSSGQSTETRPKNVYMMYIIRY